MQCAVKSYYFPTIFCKMNKRQNKSEENYKPTFEDQMSLLRSEDKTQPCFLTTVLIDVLMSYQFLFTFCIS